LQCAARSGIQLRLSLAGHSENERMSEAGTLSRGYLAERLRSALLNPVRAFKWRYLPLLMVYFAYGALGLTAIAETFWVKKSLSLSPAQLASLSVWLTMPWTVKMVFGELVDSVAILGSQRRAYVFIGGALVAAGLIMLAGAAGGWLIIGSLETSYKVASFVIVVGTVLQDVVADAMSTEVVDRTLPDGSPRPAADVDRDLGMVQVLGRLALSIGIFVVAGAAGWLASYFSYEAIFLMGLIVPVVSVSGALLVRLDAVEQRPIDWRILGGGLAFGAVVTLLAVGDAPFGQEIIFVISMAVVVAMITRVISGVDEATKRTIFYAALLIFVFRATPNVGQGYNWYAIDVLKFDEAFMGTLAQIGAGIAILGTWLFSDAITRRPAGTVLLWLTILIAGLSLPNLALTLGVHEWTERTFGFGARSIAVVDTAISSPFGHLSMIPLLTLCAIYAPAGRRASWFALMASLMNLALVAGNLQTKYLNQILVVDRGQYSNLPMLTAIVIAVGLVVPLAFILMYGGRVGHRESPSPTER
jgi:hypothetical protein